MDKYKLNTSPNQNDFNEIMDWLKEEREEYGNGFYCNRNIIKKCFDEEEFITFQLSGKNIGFALWRIFENTGYIEVFEIHPKYRNNGSGKYFGNECLHFLKQKQCNSVELECVPRDSQYFWKQLGFNNMETQFEDKIILNINLNSI